MNSLKVIPPNPHVAVATATEHQDAIAKRAESVPPEAAISSDPGIRDESLKGVFGDMPCRILVAETRDFAILHVDREQRIIGCNAGAAAVFGCDPKEAMGKPFASIFTDEDVESGVPARELREAAETGRSEDERWHQRVDGRFFFASGVTTALRGENGDLLGFIKVTRDETRRKQAELDLNASEVRYRRVFEAAKDGILILDAETGQIADVNPFMCNLLDYTRVELLGKELWEIGLFKDKEESRAAFLKLQVDGYIRYEDRPLATKRGLPREVEFVSNVYLENERSVIQCNIRDITARKRSEHERDQLLARTLHAQSVAEGANRLKDEFLATLSHELRTPLTSILGWAEMLGKARLDAATSLRAIEVIRRNARMQVQMVDDLLDVSRIITGKLRMNVQNVDLSASIMAAVESMRPAAEAKEIRLETQLDTPAARVLGDPARLQQVAWNLVANAIKFTPQGGRVLVRQESVNSHIEITVTDTGKGMAAEFLPHAFDRFRQADATTTRQQGGLGLGLAIVRQLVELHGGTVQVKSAGEGQGATFMVSLPLIAVLATTTSEEPVASPIRTPPEFNGPPQLEGLGVLVVDDEVDTLELIQAVLESFGLRVRTASTVAAAMAAMRDEAFDVLISDIAMPEEDGYSLIAQVRALGKERGGGIPAAALTVYAGREDRMRTLRAGFQLHAPKPISPDELIAVVANLAERASQERYVS
jgi:PAS domain S-box-containing protein